MTQRAGRQFKVASTIRFLGVLISSAVAAIVSQPAHAANAPALPANQLCRPAIVSAEAGARLPARLLEAIAIVESGRMDKQSGQRNPWPWTINAEGEGYFFDSKSQAIAAVRALQARGVASIDVGCMQVNLLHHPNAFANLEEAFDPYANARYAARYLNDLYGRTSNWPQATGFYHSQTPELGADYQRRVLAVWENPLQNSGTMALSAKFSNQYASGKKIPGAIQIRSIPIFDSGFAAMPRSGYIDVVDGGAHYRAFVPASQQFAAFGRSR